MNLEFAIRRMSPYLQYGLAGACVHIAMVLAAMLVASHPVAPLNGIASIALLFPSLLARDVLGSLLSTPPLSGPLHSLLVETGAPAIPTFLSVVAGIILGVAVEWVGKWLAIVLAGLMFLAYFSIGGLFGLYVWEVANLQ